MVNAPSVMARERLVDSGGVPILVTEFPHAGRPPVVLLHGIASRGQSWWPVIEPLARHFHLYQIDLRGHGGSGKPERGYLVETFADDLQQVLDALDLEAPRILGHSLGALVSLVWASENPARAARLVLEDPPLHTEPEILGAFDGWQQLASLAPEAAAAWYREHYPAWSEDDCRRRAETITSTAPGVFTDLRAASAEALACGDTDRTPLLRTIESPVLMVHGNPELGSMVTAADIAGFERLTPRGQVAAIPLAGHNLHRDATEAFLAAVIPFLA